MDYRLENVEALWPRIDKAYAWNEAKGQSDETSPTDKTAHMK